MNINHITQGIFSENQLGTKSLQLRDGQIVFGKINKLFPQQMAEVQIGNQKMMANLSIPLSLHNQYWFQVDLTKDKPILKVLGEPKDGEKVNVSSLLRQLSLPETNESKALIQNLLTNNLPVTKDIVQNASMWLKDSSMLKQDLATIRLMVERNMPLTQEVFQSLSTVQSSKGLTELLNHMQIELAKNNQSQSEIIQLLSKMNQEGVSLENDKPTVDLIKEVIQRVGYSYENELTNAILSQKELLDNKEMLKPLLLELLKSDVPASVKEVASQVIEKITGYQLLSQPVGPMMQLITEIPLRFMNQQIDVTLQYNGRKKEDGTVDSDYCRILFYLELAHLKETVIDMHVQNRIMSITVHNDKSDELASIIQHYSEDLKRNLKEAQYTLLSITTKPLSKLTEDTVKYGSSHMGISSYRGVDLKI
ncbi:hypothetical protein [Bacillus sp. B1-b2]|uniref:hypothetical protein n=1 Tax=Bacillus sp. B1-b2 TaxID=2653201 RepID=UPI0012627185|nr:hypothetical protein [Bacillus sp. B1-b2]KAB7668624.1 hypothetical protein F9279_12370 [Bacillus sp. B1-b2]